MKMTVKLMKIIVNYGKKKFQNTLYEHTAPFVVKIIAENIIQNNIFKFGQIIITTQCLI